jgi:hypothetical protein
LTAQGVRWAKALGAHNGPDGVIRLIPNAPDGGSAHASL